MACSYAKLLEQKKVFGYGWIGTTPKWPPFHQYGGRDVTCAPALASKENTRRTQELILSFIWFSWFSPLFREVFLRVLRFSPLLKKQHFQIPIRSGTHGLISTSSYELLSDPWVNKLQFTIYKKKKRERAGSFLSWLTCWYITHLAESSSINCHQLNDTSACGRVLTCEQHHVKLILRTRHFQSLA